MLPSTRSGPPGAGLGFLFANLVDAFAVGRAASSLEMHLDIGCQIADLLDGVSDLHVGHLKFFAHSLTDALELMSMWSGTMPSEDAEGDECNLESVMEVLSKRQRIQSPVDCL